MLKIILYSTLLLVAFLYIGELKITIKPFAISLPYWRTALGVFMIMIGAGIYHNAGYRKGWNEALDKVKEVIDQQKTDSKTIKAEV
jgi:small neutral amino acid transporter SnatA (MarC family)